MSDHPTTPDASPLDQVVIVLVEPQDPINVGNTVRAMKNMGLTRLRLVNPGRYDARMAAISAPKAQDILDTLEIHDTLDDALADTVLTVATTARSRRARREVARPGEAAERMLRRAAEGPVALLFGREDSGLPNSALDRAHLLVTIPTRPDYSSLNLGQAVLLLSYELFQRAGRPEPLPTPKRDFALATAQQFEGMLGQIEDTLWSIEFFKSGTSEGIVRTMRGLLHRAELDEREARVLRGVFAEVLKYAERARRGE